MSGEPTYSTACVNEPKKAFQFLTQYLSFYNYQQENTAQKGVLIGNKFGNNYLLQSNLSGAEGDLSTIVINTDNCLRDFHQLKDAGIRIERPPKYTTNGLEAIIADNYGNRYVLVEKRDYSE